MKEHSELGYISRILRFRSTPWEVKMWSHLRGRRFLGLKFKRQVPIGKYVVDFSCQKKKLIIELDGSQHNTKRVQGTDREKERFLKDRGYTVLRLWNNEVDNNMEGVLETIRRFVE